MLIDSPEIKKTVIDYDIVLDFGVTVPITIDPSKGDTIELGDKIISIHMPSKASDNNPEHQLPAEDMTIFVSHVVSIQRREREVVELSPEQKLIQAKMFKEWGTIQ